ncbi:hypothetical protein PCCS19_05070 [Paenibacillus sp. CCS19]|uniref:endo-1,4-beta-xylanase n=1 Tax=Paenibacillus sp. CCS19 TaxID=3158387 RepID=UPI00256682B4|nr:endo-1,4-beta-xylanase [Paenibacillus cellulosilyticus]GMK37453.1 hypothetical protein PCCS19_05070 [Paenibacillus cellulosilyticus]
MNKRFKQVLMVVFAIALFLPQFGLTHKANAADAPAVPVGKVIYDLQQDSQLAAGAFQGTAALQKAGDNTFTVVDNGGVKAINISGRTANWNAIDIKTAPLKASGATSFHIVVTGRIPADATVAGGTQMKLGYTNSPYTEMVKTSEVKAGDSFTLEYALEAAELNTMTTGGLNVRIQDTSGMSAFSIDGIKITSGGSTGGGTPPVVTPPVSDKVVVAYDLQQDIGLADLVSGGGSTYLQRAGNLTINAVSNTNGTVSLDLSNRTLNYEGVDVKASAMGLKADAAYTVNMTGHIPNGVTIPSGAQIVLSTAGGSYPTLAQVDAAGTFTLSYNGTAAADTGETTGLRIQADPGLSRFVIDTLVVSVKGGTAMPPKALSNVPGVNVSLTSNGDSWSGANIILGTDSAVWPFSTGDEAAFTPEKDAKYHLTFNATSTGAAGYRVRWVTGNENGGYTAGDTAVVTADASRTYQVGAVANGIPASFTGAGVVKSQAIDYAVDFTMSGSELAQGLIGNIAIRGTSGSQDFLLNSIKITDDNGQTLVNWVAEATTFVPDDYVWPEAKWDLTLPSLKDAYSQYFTIGNIMEPAQTTDATLTAMYEKQYNVVTAENAMKPENLLRNISSASDLSDPSKYNFAGSDQIVQWAEDHNQSIHGHTLVWHSQTPAFINTGASGTRVAAKANMETFINNVIAHFDSSNLISWDVVNEAFDDNTAKFDGSDWRTGLRTGSPWYTAYANGADASKGESGADYIYDAFAFAHLAQVQIDSTAKLYYNDYNETYKYEEIAQMVEDLNAQWEQDARYDGRKLIEGIGMQSHFWINSKPDVNVQEVERAIKRFVETGARISVSELDIPYSANNNYHLDEAKLAEQAQQYGTLFTIYKQYADSIDRVTFWGKADIQSWRGSGMPSLFDNSFRPKTAFWTVIGLGASTNNNNPIVIIPEKPKDTDPATDPETDTGAGEQTPTPEKPVLNSAIANAEQLKANAQQALEANSPVIFSDVPTTHWAAKAIELASQLGVVEGNNGEFEGSANVSRAEFAAMIVRALGIDTTAADGSFSDTDGHWADAAIRALHRAGIVNGTGNGSFHPDQAITRAEMAAILARVLNMSEANGAPKFSDISGHWAADNIAQLNQAGIVNGVSDGKFAPNDTATRNESVTIIMRMLNIVLDLGLNL